MLLRSQHIIHSTDAFNATTSAISFGEQDSSQNPTGQTVLARVFPVGAGESNFGYVLAKTPSSSTAGLRLFIDHNVGSPRWAFGASSFGEPSQPGRTASDNTVTYNRWNDVVVTWDGSLSGTGIRIYAGLNNGTLSEVSYSSSNDGLTSVVQGVGNVLVIGNRAGSDRTFNGTIASVARWNRVLSQDEILLAQRYGPLCVNRGLILCYANGRDYSPYRIMPTSVVALQGGMMPQNRRLGHHRAIWINGVSAGVTVSPGVVTHSYTGVAPQVKASVAPGAVAHTYTGVAPQVRASVGTPSVTHSYTAVAPQVRASVAPGAATHEYSGVAPKLQSSVQPGAATHTYTGLAPNLNGVVTVSAETATHTYTGVAPQVRASVAPGAASHSYTGVAPKVNAQVAGAVATHTYTGQTPDVQSGTRVQPGAVAHSYTGIAPKLNVMVSVGVVTHTYTGRVPTIDTGEPDVVLGRSRTKGVLSIGSRPSQLSTGRRT